MITEDVSNRIATVAEIEGAYHRLATELPQSPLGTAFHIHLELSHFPYMSNPDHVAQVNYNVSIHHPVYTHELEHNGKPWKSECQIFTCPTLAEAVDTAIDETRRLTDTACEWEPNSDTGNGPLCINPNCSIHQPAMVGVTEAF